MRLGLHQSARMEQRLLQSPQMIQAMQILQMSSQDLQGRIEAELAENPFLEVDEPGSAEAEEGEAENGTVRKEPRAEERAAAREDARVEREGRAEREERVIEGLADTLERYEDYGRDLAGPRGSSEDGDRKIEAMQNTPSSYRSLGDALLDELALVDLDERSHRIAEYLVYSLDARGFLTDPIEQLALESGIEGATAEEFSRVLEDLRRATHPSLGARDLLECLRLQIDPEDEDAELLLLLVDQHLGDLTENRLPRIAKVTARPMDEVKRALDKLKALDPFPAREYGAAPAENIHPDVVVEEVDGEFVVRLTREGIPELTISRAYRSLLKNAPRGDDLRKWIRQRLENARWFIDALEQRQGTLERIATAVFTRQRGFLEKGVPGLIPLRMMEVADATRVHISTVSRAVAGKYAQTPFGIFPLRFFFTGGTARAEGGMASQASIKQRIKEFVEKEDASHPLSDDRLAEILKERDGIEIARRTITKYRKSLGIPASNLRRAF